MLKRVTARHESASSHNIKLSNVQQHRQQQACYNLAKTFKKMAEERKKKQKKKKLQTKIERNQI